MSRRAPVARGIYLYTYKYYDFAKEFRARAHGG